MNVLSTHQAVLKSVIMTLVATTAHATLALN